MPHSPEPTGEPSELAPTCRLTYFGSLLAQDYQLDLELSVRRDEGTAIEVTGRLVEVEPRQEAYPLLPVRLQLPDILEATVAMPYPFRGDLRLRLEPDGVTVRAVGRIGVDFRGFPFRLLSFDTLAGSARLAPPEPTGPRVPPAR